MFEEFFVLKMRYLCEGIPGKKMILSKKISLLKLKSDRYVSIVNTFSAKNPAFLKIANHAVSLIVG